MAWGWLRFRTDMADAADAQVHFVDVRTPQKLGSHSADLRYVDAAVSALLPYLRADDLAVGKSTVPVGTVAQVEPGPAGGHLTQLLNEVFALALAAQTPVIETDFATAELVKVAANAFLATKISCISATSEIADSFPRVPKA